MSKESRERVREMRELVDSALEYDAADHYSAAGATAAESAMMLADFVADDMTHGNLQAAQRMARQHQRLRQTFDRHSIGGFS